MRREDWAERWLWAGLGTLSRRGRVLVVVLGAMVVLGWSSTVRGRMELAWGLPDVLYYVRLARGHVGWVPAPFTSRPLAPLLARGLAAGLGVGTEGGFWVLAAGCLLWTAAVVLWLLVRGEAPRWTVLAVVMAPFWAQLLGYAGLPDPLYAALVATLLVMLERGWWYAAAGMMLPLMLARESTWLVLMCLLAVGWRRLRWSGAAVALASTEVGAALVRRWSAGGLPNLEGMSGGMYMAGKVAANGLRSLGVMPWSNVYPVLCGAPQWQMGMHVGPVRAVGVCAWSGVGPVLAAAALLGTFGALLTLLLARRGEWWGAAWREGGAMWRFCVVYGGVSVLLAPALGTWYARLVGYGWPLALVAAPRVLRGMRGGWGWGCWLGLNALVCGLGWVVPAAGVEVVAGVLTAGSVALVLVQRRHLPGNPA